MNLKNMKAMIEYIEKNCPELMEDCVEAGHDMIFFPTPKMVTVEFRHKAEELGFSLGSDGLYAFC